MSRKAHQPSLVRPIRLLLVAILFAGPSFAQTDLNGYWDLQLPSPDGNVRHTYFQLSLSGETLTGKLFGRNPGGIPLNGTYTAGHLHFRAQLEPFVGNYLKSRRQRLSPTL